MIQRVVSALQNRCTTAEARLAAMREQCDAAKEEAVEWRHKHDTIEADTKAAIERATVSKDRAIRQAQLREDALRAEFAAAAAQKVPIHTVRSLFYFSRTRLL